MERSGAERTPGRSSLAVRPGAHSADTLGRVKVLVTGGAGYIGSQTAKALATAGDEPVIVDNLGTGHRGDVGGARSSRPRLPRPIGSARSSAASGSRRHALRGACVRRRIDAGSAGSISATTSTARSSCSTPCARTACGDIVFSSTCATYGDPDRVADRRGRSRSAPVNPYGESKLIVETVAARLRRAPTACAAAALRYFNAAGAHPDGDVGEDARARDAPDPAGAPGPRSGAAARSRSSATDYPTPDGTCVRDYIHVVRPGRSAPARAATPAPRGERGGAQPRHGRGYSVREVIAAVAPVAGGRCPCAKAAPRRRPAVAGRRPIARRATPRLAAAPRVAGRDRVDRSPLARERSRARHRLIHTGLATTP